MNIIYIYIYIYIYISKYWEMFHEISCEFVGDKVVE